MRYSCAVSQYTRTDKQINDFHNEIDIQESVCVSEKVEALLAQYSGRKANPFTESQTHPTSLGQTSMKVSTQKLINGFHNEKEIVI